MFNKKKKKQEPILQGVEHNFLYALGSRAKDRITGFEGIIVNRAQWLFNCNVYGLKPTDLDKDGKPQSIVHFDEPQLEILKVEEVKPQRKTGGPTDSIPQTNRD